MAEHEEQPTDTPPHQVGGEASWSERVAPVTRSQAQARATYDRVASVYDLVEAPFERRARAEALKLLAAEPAERVLDIGPGTGHALAAIARQVGPAGMALGVDLSWRMLGRARRRAGGPGPGRPRLLQGDACRLPVTTGTVDAVFMSFVLELFDTGDIPQVLDECRRVVRPGGRLTVVSLQLDRPARMGARIYLWGHRRLPRLLDCRPIPLPEVLAISGWRVRRLRRMSLWGIPVMAALADAPDQVE